MQQPAWMTRALPTAAALGRVAVLMGGESAEREISLRSGQGVLAALKRQGVDAVAFDPAERPVHELRNEKIDRVFIALHGRFGEDGTVQGALELYKIPYTGSGVLASSMAMNKIVTKRMWSALGIDTPKFADLLPGFDSGAVIKTLGLPIAVKPAHEGSSLGFTKATDAATLKAGYELAARYDTHVVAEQFISGREFTCAVIDDGQGQAPYALPVIEIVAPEGNYDFQHKYFGNETRYLCPAPIAAPVAQHMQALSLQSFKALGCVGWARVDIMWNEKDSPTLLEINTSPGMTDHSLVPMAAAQAGLSYDELVLRLVAGASLKSAQHAGDSA